MRKKLNKTKVVYMDVNFQNAAAADSNMMECLLLQNYYCSSITIMQQENGSDYVPILENYVLMSNPHTEKDSQSWFSINTSQFNRNYVFGRNLRFHMFQPDTIWQKFEIQNIRAVYKPKVAALPPLDDCAEGLNPYNLFSMINADWKILNEAAQAQENLVELPQLNITLAEFRKNVSKKAKKKDKKGSAGQVPANDEFGIALNFPKGSEITDTPS